jgi:hypothetical protein
MALGGLFFAMSLSAAVVVSAQETRISDGISATVQVHETKATADTYSDFSVTQVRLAQDQLIIKGTLQDPTRTKTAELVIQLPVELSTTAPGVARQKSTWYGFEKQEVISDPN